METSGLLSSFILLVKKDHVGGKYYPQDLDHSQSPKNAKLPCIQ